MHPKQTTINTLERQIKLADTGVSLAKFELDAYDPGIKGRDNLQGLKYKYDQAKQKAADLRAALQWVQSKPAY